MSKKISGADYPLAKIFSSDFDYVIPSYQRPYAWTDVQAGDLFADLYDFFVKEKKTTLTSLRAYRPHQGGNPHAEVIDGQQRLTTLTILLAALTQLSTGKIRDAFHHYLCEPAMSKVSRKNHVYRFVSATESSLNISCKVSVFAS